MNKVIQYQVDDSNIINKKVLFFLLLMSCMDAFEFYFEDWIERDKRLH